MEKRTRLQVINGVFPLPEVLIQHIQSYLSSKEAARTTLLSKSWHTAWSTRPNLDFDCRNHPNKDDFWAFTNNTMQRYQHHNLKIHSFRLYTRCEFYIAKNNRGLCIYDESSAKELTTAKELIVKAMKMGTVDLNFANEAYHSRFPLPREVLESETLVRLSLYGCTVDLVEGRKVNCLGLKSLCLNNVVIEKSEIMNIISSCPLIEKFMSQQTWAKNRRSLGSVVNGPVNVYQLCKLRSLKLCHVDVETSFFSGLSSRFPLLKDLSLDECGGYNSKGIKICSHSLDYIFFKQNRLLRAKCEVPSIRKFKFEGVKLPSLFFKTASREWESDICVRGIDADIKWFSMLNELLTRLSSSRITISLSFYRIMNEDMDLGELPIAVVESLRMDAPSSTCCAIIDRLFWSCRPKFVALDLPEYEKMEKWRRRYKDLVINLGRRLAPAMSESCSMTNQDVFDLEEVSVQLKESDAAWRPLSLKTFLADLSAFKNKKTVRFQLRWRPHSSDLNSR